MKFALSIICLSLAVAFAIAHPPVAWRATYGGTGNDVAFDVGLMADRGYAIYGYTESFGAGSRDFYLVRIDSLGGMMWQRAYGQVNMDYASAGTPTSDGGHVLVGYTTPYTDPNLVQIWTVKTDSGGDTVWTGRYGTARNDWARDVKETSDGGLIIAGRTDYDGIQPYAQLMLIKVNSQHQQEWEHEYGAPYQDECGRIDFAGSGFVITGGVVNVQYGLPDAYVARINTFGQLVWPLTIQQQGAEYARAVKATSDGGFIVLIKDIANGLRLTKISGSGNLQWSTLASTGIDAWDIDTLRGGGYVAVGSISNIGIWVGRYTAEGSLQWQDTISAPGTQSEAVRQTADSGFVIAGSTSAFGAGGSDALLVKLCSEGAAAGHIAYLSESESNGAFRLAWESGFIDTVQVCDVPLGTAGWVTGTAADDWHVIPGGDGNDGDTIMFVTEFPLVSGNADTFWISRPEPRCELRWRVKCRMDSLRSWTGRASIVQFSGGSYGNYTDLDLFTSNEQNLDRFEIWGSHLLAQADAANDSGITHYAFTHVQPSSRYVVRGVDVNGCTNEWTDHILYSWQLDTPKPGGPMPRQISLSTYPNPFNPSTQIHLTLPRQSRAVVSVTDLLGRQVATVYDGLLEPGEHRFAFDGSNLPSGIYFARVQAGEFVKTQKLLLLK